MNGRRCNGRDLRPETQLREKGCGAVRVRSGGGAELPE